MKKGIDVAHLAIKYAVQAPLAKNGPIATTLVGIANSKEVDVMIKTLDPLTANELEAIKKTKEILGKWINYSWTEKLSNQEKLLQSANYTPPKPKSKL